MEHDPPFAAAIARWHETGSTAGVRARFFRLLLSVSVVSTALAGGACRNKSAEEQLREAERATVEAEEKASQTTITSAEMGAGSGASESSADEAREAQDRAMREQAEAVTATRNEQLAYRGKLQRALDELDTKRRDAKKHGAAHVKAIDARREVLKHHLVALDRTTDTEWAALKAKIDRDLRDHASDREGR